jgi:hypothetical protein
MLMIVRHRSIAILALAIAAHAQVRVWQGTMRLAASQEGPPDPNPPFDIFGPQRFNYPYTLRYNLTGESKEIDWRALFLENEYLKCSVLPDLGGHLYTCIDKISGQPMFYANPSIKKAQIGYRGAWAAFGIEFNFPVSHNWVSMSPVDFSTRANPDGSASIVVGNIDRPYGMQWEVELRLAPGSTVLEQRVTLSNPSDVRHRYYWWNNAAVRAWDDSVICYPMRWTASHGYTNVDTWPVDSSGIDLSVIRNQVKGPVSVFVHGSREPFMGVYHPHTQTGVAHYADYAELPGKKIWSWGVDADGLDWRRALSDDNSAYVEVQAGLMRDQETYAFLEPRQSIRFTEFWMPVREIGGIARANLAGVVNLRREGGKLVAGLNVNHSVPAAEIRILDGARQIYRVKGDLDPGRAWTRDFAAPTDKVTFELRAGDGAVLLRQTEGEYDWSPESEIHKGPQARYTPTDPLELGTVHELNGRLLQAYDTYTTALARAPASMPLRIAAGRLAAALLRYEDAVRWLEPAQVNASGDGEIAYYLGLVYEGLGQARRARTQFEAASRTPAWRAAASAKLAEPGPPAPARELASDPERVLNGAALRMRAGRWRDALEILSRDYADVPPEQKEPGAPLPQRHPIVQYFRAYCRARMGEPAAADYASASRLPATYIFPHGAQTLAVLEAAIRANPDDATAHYLLGNMRLTSGLADQAVAEWTTAKRLNAAIPVLDASLGRTHLRIRHDTPAALEAFRAGLGTDPANIEIYNGLEQTLSVLRRPAAERIGALERYPDRAHMPPSLVYALAIDYAEDGRFDQARALFENRFFPREEGGTNVRQVWIRVRMLEAESLVSHSRCSDALAILDHLGDPSPGLAFTRDGLVPFIAEPANQVTLGSVESHCGRAAAAADRLAAMERRRDAASVAFGLLLARELPGFRAQDWDARVRAASSPNAVVRALLQWESERSAEAIETLKSVFLLPNQNLAHHHARAILLRMAPN